MSSHAIDSCVGISCHDHPARTSTLDGVSSLGVSLSSCLDRFMPTSVRAVASRKLSRDTQTGPG